MNGVKGVAVPSSELEQARQRDMQRILKAKEFHFEPVARFLCHKFGVSDPSKIVPFGNRTDAWKLMRPVTLAFEVGSVVKEDRKDAEGKPVVDPVIFNLEPADSGEQQVKRCFLDPTTPTCRFIDSPVPPESELVVNPASGKRIPVDLDRVCVYTIVTRNSWSTVPIQVAARFNFYHKGMDALQQTEFTDMLIAEAGGIRGAYMTIAATPADGREEFAVPMPKNGFCVTNDFFTQTMALIDDSNILNGIIELPHDVCVEADLPVFSGPPEPLEEFVLTRLANMSVNPDQVASTKETIRTEFKQKWTERSKNRKFVTTFFAIPIDHVLAWPLSDEDYLSQHGGMERKLFGFTPPGSTEPIILYFLVPDAMFHSMLAEFKRTWMGKVDMRPLKSIAVEFIPDLVSKKYSQPIPPETKQVGGVLSLRSYITYMAPIKGLDANIIKTLAPTRVPEFPPCHNWTVDANIDDLVLDQMRAAAGKTK